jgi:hypothetical protein
MRSTIPVLLLLVVGLCCSSCRSTHNPIATWTPREGFEYLIVARSFAFGGIGYDGRTSTGEYAFRAVLRAPDAPTLFKTILSPGAQATEEGKLYALCGIRATDRSDFDSYADILVGTNAEVTVQSGCTVYEESATEVVKRIRDGDYDSQFTKR